MTDGERLLHNSTGTGTNFSARIQLHGVSNKQSTVHSGKDQTSQSLLQFFLPPFLCMEMITPIYQLCGAFPEHQAIRYTRVTQRTPLFKGFNV